MTGKVITSSSNELTAGIRSQAADDLARLGALARRTGNFIHSELRGSSMGTAIPHGALIRIRPAAVESWRTGDIIAFVAGHRFMAHRIVYEGRRGAARGFVLTQGDGNWLCDPPVNRCTIVGGVDMYQFGPDWRPVGRPEIPFPRWLVSGASQAVMRVAVECSPGFAIALARVVSWGRMGPRLVISRLRRALGGHVRP